MASSDGSYESWRRIRAFELELEIASDPGDDIDGASRFSIKSGTDAIKGVFVLDVGARKFALELCGVGREDCRDTRN